MGLKKNANCISLEGSDWLVHVFENQEKKKIQGMTSTMNSVCIDLFDPLLPVLSMKSV